EIGLALSFGPQPQAVGDGFVYAVTVTNDSIQGSDQTVLTVVLPSGVEFVAFQVNRGPGCAVAGQTVTCNLDWFPGKFTDVVRITVRVTAAADLTARASVWSMPSDPNPANDTASVTTHVGAPVALPTP